MVASKDTSAPLVVVIGSTGIQGGSVIRHLIASEKPYRIRGVTRDAPKPNAVELADQGVTVVSGDIANKEDLDKAFSGADIIFAVTNFWLHGDKARDLADGKRIVDSVKAANVKLFIWSGLENVNKESGGKYPNVEHFDVKAEVLAYAKSEGVPVADVQPAGYMENFLTSFAPRKQPDGSFVIASPVTPATKMALINCGRDYGAYVVAAIESPSLGVGSEVLACAEELSLEQITKIWAETLGKKCVFVQLEKDAFRSIIPGAAGEDLLQMLGWFQDFGYYGTKDIKPSQAHLKAPSQTWAEFVEETDWSKVTA